MEEIEVLFEYEGSKTMLTCKRSEIKKNIYAKLESLGHNLKTPSTSDNFILQKYSKKWDTFVDVDAVDSVITGDRLSIIPINSQKNYGEVAEKIISAVKQPSQAEAKALSSFFPSASSTRKIAAFDPAAESIVLSKQRKKKAAIKRKRPSKIAVVMLDEYRSAIPKGKYRQKLAAKGKIQSILFNRSMSAREVKNIIIRAFGVDKYIVHDVDSTGHCLIRCADQLVDGDAIVDRKGALYLSKEITEASVEFCLSVGT